ncbi:MAG TPA: hypothetical protein VI248_08920 [Kineosporiaceae bacterium]
MTAETAPKVAVHKNNPYRGPREFGRGERLPNRSREARQLTDRVIADRVVLLHSPSGAGKSSLIEAAVVPLLETRGFHTTPRLRVNDPGPGDGVNPYVQSVITYLFTGSKIPPPPLDTALADAVKLWAAGRHDGEDSARRNRLQSTVLIFDQLEEVLILNPTDWAGQDEFFAQLGEMLTTEPVWALFSMREDYMGGLDRYLPHLPGMLESRYRLDLLERDDAKLAMQVPAGEQGVTFTDEASDLLFKKLAHTQVHRPDMRVEIREAPYVEPVQVQVVCRQLWKHVRDERPGFTTIELTDVERHADVDTALTRFFGDTVGGVVTETGADERNIRDWVETQLITKDHFRSQTTQRPAVKEPDRVLTLLQDGYLIRGDVRASTIWYELSHDRLVRPVLASNQAWRRRGLQPWQVDAYNWDHGGRRPASLPQATSLPVVTEEELTPLERDYLDAWEKEIRQQGIRVRLRATRTMAGVLAVLAVAEAVVIIVLIVLLLRP